MSKGNPFLSLRVPRETMDLLHEASARRGRNVSDLAREALSRGLLSDPLTVCAGASLGQGHDRGSVSRPRKQSRVQRAASAVETLRRLQEEYEEWQASLPEFAEQSATADKLEHTLETLGTALEVLEELDLPRGYGRD